MNLILLTIILGCAIVLCIGVIGVLMCLCKMYREEIEQLEKELYNLIDYDEWSAREYGDTRVDYYWTAFNLIKAGYRKVVD